MLKVKKYKINELNLVTFFLMLSPIVDNLNGFLLLNKINTNISSLYKAALLFFLLFALFFTKYKYSKRTLKAALGLVVLIVLSLFVNMIYNIQSFGSNINTTIKLLMPFVLCFYYSERFKQEKIINSVKRVFDFYIWFYPISLIIPSVLGIGFDTYYTGTGSKGFYYAGNEISAIMIVICFYSIKKCIVTKKKSDLFNFILNLIATIFIGTKSVYLALAFIFTVYILSNIIKKRKFLQIIFCVILLIIGGVIIYEFNKSFFDELLQSWANNYEFHIKGNFENELLAFILSSRNGKLVIAGETLTQERGLMGLLIGAGYFFLVEENFLLIEMDLFDLLLWYGLVPSVYIISLIIGKLKLYWKKYDIYSKTLFITMLGFSILAGHVLFATSVLMVVVLFYLYASFENNLYSYR